MGSMTNAKKQMRAKGIAELLWERAAYARGGSRVKQKGPWRAPSRSTDDGRDGYAARSGTAT
jgi:hypothetical protein